jgi:hypothetical protein
MAIKVAHAIPGRIRLRGLDTKNNGRRVEGLREQIATFPSVRRVDVNRTCGSLVVNYEPSAQQSVQASLMSLFPGLSGEQFQSAAKRLADSSTNGAAVAGGITTVFSRLNKTVERATGGFDLRVLVPLALTAFAVLVLILALLRRKKPPAPSWYDLLWFAFNTFIILNLSSLVPREGKTESQETAAPL